MRLQSRGGGGGGVRAPIFLRDDEEEQEDRLGDGFWEDIGVAGGRGNLYRENICFEFAGLRLGRSWENMTARV